MGEVRNQHDAQTFHLIIHSPLFIVYLKALTYRVVTSIAIGSRA
jgi:hypothetical protein